MKEFFLKNVILVTIIVVLIYFIPSLYVINNMSEKLNENNEKHIVKILSTSINGKNYDTIYDYIDRYLYNSDMYIIDNKGDTLYGTSKKDLDKSEIFKILGKDKDSIYYMQSNINGYDEDYTVIQGKDYNIVFTNHLTRTIDYITFFIVYIVITAFLILSLCIYLNKKFKARLNKDIYLICRNIKTIGNGDNPDVMGNDDFINIEQVIYETSADVNKKYSNLVSEKEKWNLVFSNINQGIVLIDSNKNIITINDICLNMFNVKTDIGKSKIHSLIFDRDFMYILDDVMKSGRIADFDYNYKSHIIYNISIMESDKTLNEGNSKLYIIIITNVSENRNFMKMRQEFFSDASHELKTPITSIIGFSELLVGDIIKDENKKNDYLQKILNQGQKMSNTINDILKIANYDENMQEVGDDKVNISNIINKVIDNITPQINDMNVEINKDVDDTILTIGMEHCIDLVQNLIENAVKYNKENGSVNITVKRQNKNILMIIEDTGIGISEKYIDSCFERFFRVDKSRSNKFGSTGLGLSIVKNIVDLYGGTIKIQSQLNIGTKIEIII